VFVQKPIFLLLTVYNWLTLTNDQMKKSINNVYYVSKSVSK